MRAGQDRAHGGGRHRGSDARSPSPSSDCADGTAVIRVLIGQDELSEGVLQARLALLGLAFVLLLLAIAVGDTPGTVLHPPDRGRRRHRRPARRVATSTPVSTRAGRRRPGRWRSRSTVWPRGSSTSCTPSARPSPTSVTGCARRSPPCASTSRRLPTGPERERLADDVGALTRIDRRRDHRGPATDPRGRATPAVTPRPSSASRIAFWSALAEDEGRRVDVRSPTDPLVVASTATDLAATVDALLGNVFAHTPARIARSPSPLDARGRRSCSTVADDGPGWRLAHAEAARSLGRRLDRARSRHRRPHGSGVRRVVWSGQRGARAVVRWYRPPRPRDDS